MYLYKHVAQLGVIPKYHDVFVVGENPRIVKTRKFVYNDYVCYLFDHRNDGDVGRRAYLFDLVSAYKEL